MLLKKKLRNIRFAIRKPNMADIVEEPHSEVVSRILQKGEIIKPVVSEETVRGLAERLYGISCLEIKELNSYDDKNFKITEDTNMKNPIIPIHCPYGYVLKIMNSLDSQKLGFVEAQTEAMIFLSKHEIGCPKPIRDVYGHYFSLEKIEGKSHVVRLLEYQPGEILSAVPKSDFLFYQVGEYIAKMDRLLKKKFYHSGFENHKTIWMLENVMEIENFKYSVQDLGMLRIIDEVLQEFKEHVLPEVKTLERGLLHGDFNEQNIVVNLNKNPVHENDWRITSVIDFGDMQVSCYIFELAITMAYAMIVGKDLKVGGLVLGGYSLVRIVPPKEMQLLRICIAARFCQSYVMGAYTHAQDSSNTYVLSTKAAIELLLPMLWKETNEDAAELWKAVADDYLTKSTR